MLFPHCKCDARKTGHVIMSVGSGGIGLKACSDEGVKEDVSINNIYAIYSSSLKIKK